MFDMRSCNRFADITGYAFGSGAFRLTAAALMALAPLFLFARTASAHEQWIVTPEQIVQWNAKPRPEFYTIWSAGNVTLILAFSLFIMG
jgi:hypothetical protein